MSGLFGKPKFPKIPSMRNSEKEIDEERRRQFARRSGGGTQSTIISGNKAQGPLLGSSASLVGGTLN